MATFVENQEFYVEHCCSCGLAFAITRYFERQRRNDRAYFYCPAGHSQHYTGPSEAEKLRGELALRQNELARKDQMLDAAQQRANRAEEDRKQITKAHQRMRERVMNGVCPCCNRTFQNLMSHMRSEHPDFSATRTLFTLRQTFGMTQAQVAKEADVHAVHVSLYERDKPVARRVKERLDDWVASHDTKAQP